MKKKFSALLAVLLSGVCLPVISLNANASGKSMIDFAYHQDEYAIETDTFQYVSNANGKFSSKLDFVDFVPTYIVTGVLCYGDETNYAVTYTVLSCAGERGFLSAGSINDYVDGRELQIGDVIGSPQNGAWTKGTTFPSTYYPACEVKYLGNGVDLYGTDFMKVMRHEMVIVDEAGYYSKIENVDIIKGDVTEDEEIGIVDVLAINQTLLGIHTLSNYGELAGDVNGNGSLDDADAMTILKSLVGLAEL